MFTLVVEIEAPGRKTRDADCPLRLIHACVDCVDEQVRDA
ncbi:MAG: hypothetical protein BWY92_01777 [Firmicutes bacterium ADurb.BinA052]|nr:MAG: hypothetical protein BWY92_01777 [Firmicutes bacterium ADurb.BinA052]